MSPISMDLRASTEVSPCLYGPNSRGSDNGCYIDFPYRIQTRPIGRQIRPFIPPRLSSSVKPIHRFVPSQLSERLFQAIAPSSEQAHGDRNVSGGLAQQAVNREVA